MFTVQKKKKENLRFGENLRLGDTKLQGHSE